MINVPVDHELVSLGELLAPLEADLGRVEERIADALKTDLEGIRALQEHVMALGGKRLRPALVLLIAKSLGEIRDEHLRLAVVVELIHTATLVHDDIIDEARIRRAMLSIPSLWGEELAVLFGDFLYSRAFSLIADFADSKVVQEIARTTCRMCEGELLQVFQRNNLDLAREKYFEIIERKTAALIAISAGLSAHLSGRPEPEVETFATFGRRIGIAFQIIDDCLDLVGVEQRVGKTLGSDLKKGKMTLPMIHLLQHCTPAERQALRSWIRNGDSVDPPEGLKDWLERCDSINAAKQIARDEIAAARSELAELLAPEVRAPLEALAEFFAKRAY